MNLIEITNKGIWTVSSYSKNNSIKYIYDNNLNTYWESNGIIPHWIFIEYSIPINLYKIALFIPNKLDYLYTPYNISIETGNIKNQLTNKYILNSIIPNGWIDITILDNSCKFIKININKIYNNGINVRIR